MDQTEKDAKTKCDSSGFCQKLKDQLALLAQLEAARTREAKARALLERWLWLEPCSDDCASVRGFDCDCAEGKAHQVLDQDTRALAPSVPGVTGPEGEAVRHCPDCDGKSFAEKLACADALGRTTLAINLSAKVLDRWDVDDCTHVEPDSHKCECVSKLRDAVREIVRPHIPTCSRCQRGGAGR